jgi:hypothetical protein
MTADNIRATATPHKSRISSFKVRDAWMRRLLAADGEKLSPCAKIVAIRLALHHNFERDQCNPSIRELVLGTSMSESTVRRAIRELEKRGWLNVTRTSGGHRFSSSNSFELRAPPLSEETGDTPVADDSGQDCHPCQGRHPTPVAGDTLPLSIVTPRKEKRKAKEKSEEEDSLQLDLGEQDSGRRSQSPSSQTETDADFDEFYQRCFEEFYRCYPKRVARAAALRAYRGALKKGATPAEILVGAMRAAAAYQRDAERRGHETAHQFAKNPSSWLNAECWADEPAKPIGGDMLDGDGNPITPPPNQSQRASSPSWMDVAMGGLNRGQP